MYGQCPQSRVLVVILMMASAVSIFAAKPKKCPSVCVCGGKKVDCSNQNILQIPKGIPDATKDLNLAGNNLRGVDNSKIRRLKKLRFLDLSNNKIEELERDAFSGVKSLRELKLNGNQLQHLPNDVFDLLKNLENLDLSGNYLTSVEGTFVNMSRVLQLHLQNNQIARLTYKSFKGMNNLQYLNMESNNISNIDVLAFWDMTSLRQLVLRNNFLKQADGLFVENPDLQSLDLANTRLKNFPKVLPLHIEVLHLDQNNISAIRRDDTNDYIRLRTLMLYENSLTSIEDDCFTNMQDLQELWLNMNKLQRIPAGLPASLKHLSLDNNEVSAINSNDFPVNSNMKVLSLQFNVITRLEDDAFQNLASLNELYLGGNSFTVFRNNVFSPLRNLQSLNLLRFDLDLIEENAFHGLSNLRSLDLSYILMRSSSGIQGNIFKWLSNLTTLALQESPEIASKLITSEEMLSSISSVRDLNLMDNAISSLSLNLVNSLKQLKSIQLPGNPFHCDSLLRWLQDFIKIDQTKFFMPNDILCHTPIELRGQSIVDVQYSDFVPATTSSTTTTLLPMTTTVKRSGSAQSNKTMINDQSNHTSQPQMTSVSPEVNTVSGNVTMVTSAHTGNDDKPPEEENFIMITVVTSISTAAIIIVVAVAVIVIFHRRRYIQHDFEYCRENEVEFYVSDGSDRPPVKLTREERQSRGSVTSKAEEDITNELDLSMRVYTWDDGEQ